MDFKLNIGTLTTTIKEYNNLAKILNEQKQNINNAISNLYDLGWSGEAREQFEVYHNALERKYAELEEDIKYLQGILENEEKPKAVLLKKRCEGFAECVARGGVATEGTSDDEGIISLDFIGSNQMREIIDRCTSESYNKMNNDFQDVSDIIGGLEYTSFNIGDNVNECEDSVGNQKIRLKNFEESLVLYCQGVKEMESNICSKLEKISGQANETCDTAKDCNASLNAKIEGTTKTNEIYLNEVTSKMNDLSDNLDKLNYENSSEMKYKLNEVYQSEDAGNVDTIEDKSTIQKVIDEFKGIIDKFVDRLKNIFEYIGKEAGKVYEQLTNQLNKLKDSLVSLGKVIYEFLNDAGVVAVKLIGTLVCIGVDWCLQFVIGTVELLAKIAEYVPLGDLYELSAEDTTKDIQNVEEVVHNFFKELAPYKDLYEYGETALDIITIFLSVKSLIKTGGKLLVNSGKILSEIEKIFQETGGGLQLAIEGGGKLGTEAIEAAAKLEQSLGKSIKDVVKDSLGLGSIINKIESEVMGEDGAKGAADPITKSEYSSLRKKTPSNDIRKMVNPEGPKIDPVYGYATDVLEADHIVPMKEIVDMPGFTQLSREQQIEVLNLQDNFIGLGKSTNASKGAKNWTDWKGHSKLGEVPSDVRVNMLELESSARTALQKAIEERLRK